MKDKTKRRLNKAKLILLGDMRDGIDFIISCTSAIFWIWLEVIFLKFFFTFAFGIVGYITGGGYPEAIRQLLINKGLIDTLILAFVLLQLITRIRIPFQRKFKEKK